MVNLLHCGVDVGHAFNSGLVYGFDDMTRCFALRHVAIQSVDKYFYLVRDSGRCGANFLDPRKCWMICHTWYHG